jgi:hypothetical protein
MLPFADSEPVLPKPSHRAVHHIVGRIWRHRPQRRVAELGPPDPSLRSEGCEAHVTGGGVRSHAAPRRLPALMTPAVPVLAASVLAGASFVVIIHALVPPSGSRHTGHAHPHVAVLEPGSLFLMLSGLAALAVVSTLARRSAASTPADRQSS